jgi:hypothetical protein
MPGTFSRANSFRRGTLGADGRLLLLLVNDELAKQGTPHTCVVVWDNGKFVPIVTTAWTACGAVFTNWPDCQFAVVGEKGELLRVRVNNSHAEEPLFTEPPARPVMLKALSCSETRLIVAGVDHLVYALDSDGRRTDISPAKLSPKLTRLGVGFEGVHARSPRDAYAVGWEGAIWHFLGDTWSVAPSPTNAILGSVLCTPPGDVWACGQDGTVVRGDGDRWRIVEAGLTDSLWSLAWFGGAVFAVSSRELFRFDEGDEPQRVGLDSDPETFYWLDAKRGEVMLSTGAKDCVLVLPEREIRID